MNNNEIAVKIKNISKCYRIGVKEQTHDTVGRTVIEFMKRPLKNYRKYRSLYKFDDIHTEDVSESKNSLSDLIWALKDLSFNVKKGEVVGIIGRNGSGKSTLLKILSRITYPTNGSAKIVGRVSSLLEVGTGFNPELTGRENVYLNSTILGMKKIEIDKKFDSIIDFSGVEKFIDTPVKRYSSGMRVRLAFAVAAHIEPEILIIDEVLAVGDAEFQKKCLGKMEDVAKEGRTVLFVSHNMGAVENLCSSVVWINEGKLVVHGDTQSTIRDYLQETTDNNNTPLKLRKRHGTGEASITDARLLNSNNDQCDSFRMGDTIIVEFDVEFYRFFQSIDLALEVKRTGMRLTVLHLVSGDYGLSLENISAGKHSFRVELPDCMLYPASYTIKIWVGDKMENNSLSFIRDALSFTMIQSSVTKRTTRLSVHKEAIFYIPSKWVLVNSPN